MGKNKAGRIIEVLNQELTYMMLLFTLQVERSGEKAELFAWYGTLKMPPLHSNWKSQSIEGKKTLSISESKCKRQNWRCILYCSELKRSSGCTEYKTRSSPGDFQR